MDRTNNWDEINANGTAAEKMNAFLTNEGNTYAILQLRDGSDTAKERFMSLRGLKRQGIRPTMDHYEVIYAAPLPPYQDRGIMLEMIYEKFNVNHPKSLRGHSLSVSDVVALRENGKVTCHYVDSIGYRELPAFLKPENYLKNAEILIEDDYGMIDGIINNGQPVEQKPSVLDRLHREGETERADKPDISGKRGRARHSEERSCL